MTRRALCISLLLGTLQLNAPVATAQRQWNNWHFGSFAWLDFNAGAPVAVANSRLNTTEGTAAISDPKSGELLFYTDGIQVWNRNHTPMPGGTALGGHFSSTQSALIVPDPGDPERYYIFTTDGVEVLVGTIPGSYDGVSYVVVDMRGDGGSGAVVTPLTRLAPTNATERLCGVRRQRDGTCWVIAHEFGTNTFYAYHLSAAGITDTVVSHSGLMHGPFTTHAASAGHLKASPDGRQLAAVRTYQKGLELFSFDPETGIVADPRLISPEKTFFYNVSFSPNGSLLYATWNPDSLSPGEYRVVQYDLLAGNQEAISSSAVLLHTGTTEIPAAMQHGPDGKIYVALLNQRWLDVIAAPNSRGDACGYTVHAVSLGSGISQLGLPNIIDSDQGPAAPVDMPELSTLDNDFVVTPNPASGSTQIHVRLPHQTHVRLGLYSATGNEAALVVDAVLSPGDHEWSLDAGSLASGIYTCRLLTSEGVRNIVMVVTH